ncbi:NeuD/PglB/VioB family sugar acetyltransferase [Lysobacter sp. A378]
MRKIGIFGAGGHAREILGLLDDLGMLSRVSSFVESDELWNERSVAGFSVKRLSQFDCMSHDVVIAIGDSFGRRAIRAALPSDVRYPILVHPTVVRGSRIEMGPGSIICAGSVLTCDIVLGEHVHLNRTSNIGHDCGIDNFVTTAPGVVIGGNCTVGEATQIGASACVRERTKIASEVVIGMGAVVVSSIHETGVYFGNPAKKRVL